MVLRLRDPKAISEKRLDEATDNAKICLKCTRMNGRYSSLN